MDAKTYTLDMALEEFDAESEFGIALRVMHDSDIRRN
jgi:hypothetical protein